ncbi:HAMP domain-containing histidine kinase, partial [Candidatus Pacearchaeota archaeon]|nr:HAMP domain-containing histidine kinase [Candidatus Pacearchaeota archaeon]
LGKTVKEILKPHHILTAVSNWQKETETHTPKEIKVQALSDETLAIIRESAIVIENESGRSIGVLSALQNITQKEELNRRKNDILDVLGHDLRAPLGAIKMNFDILTETTNLNVEGSEQQKKFLDNCNNNITRMSRLIEKILDTRQLEAGKIMLKYDTVDTTSLIEQAVTSLTEWAGNKNITLKANASQLPNIDGDPERLYQVITNLVSNALKFTPEKGSIIAKGKTVKNKGTEYVEISVKDSGMGIDQENLKRIFDKYEQVTVNAPAGVRGLGLGLSICKTIIELHSGSIRADSELEKGSTFTFQIPVKQKSEEGKLNN